MVNEEAGKRVSVLIPCRNEARHIERCLQDVCTCDAPDGGFEVIVVDGLSNDGTPEVLSRMKCKWPQLRVVDNPGRIVPRGMNLGILEARGEYIIRADVRCTHPKSYLRDLIALSERTGADNVGGVLVPVSEGSYAQKSIVLAYKSRIAMGGALRDRGDFCGETDTVYGGCFKRKRLLEIGMYDEGMVRNQDDELSFRLRKSGGKIVQDGSIKVYYYPRSSFRQLFKQFMQYGYWKVVVVKKHPQQASARHLLPAALVSGFVVLPVLASVYSFALAALGIYTAAYSVSVGIESLRLASKASIKLWPGAFAAIVIIHVGFGIGFMVNLVCRLIGIKPKWFESLSR